jgi:hypothetical protein
MNPEPITPKPPASLPPSQRGAAPPQPPRTAPAAGSSSTVQPLMLFTNSPKNRGAGRGAELALLTDAQTFSGTVRSSPALLDTMNTTLSNSRHRHEEQLQRRVAAVKERDRKRTELVHAQHLHRQGEMVQQLDHMAASDERTYKHLVEVHEGQHERMMELKYQEIERRREFSGRRSQRLSAREAAADALREEVYNTPHQNRCPRNSPQVMSRDVVDRLLIMPVATSPRALGAAEVSDPTHPVETSKEALARLQAQRDAQVEQHRLQQEQNLAAKKERREEHLAALKERLDGIVHEAQDDNRRRQRKRREEEDRIAAWRWKRQNALRAEAIDRLANTATSAGESPGHQAQNETTGECVSAEQNAATRTKVAPERSAGPPPMHRHARPQDDEAVAKPNPQGPQKAAAPRLNVKSHQEAPPSTTTEDALWQKPQKPTAARNEAQPRHNTKTRVEPFNEGNTVKSNPPDAKTDSQPSKTIHATAGSQPPKKSPTITDAKGADVADNSVSDAHHVDSQRTPHAATSKPLMSVTADAAPQKRSTPRKTATKGPHDGRSNNNKQTPLDKAAVTPTTQGTAEHAAPRSNAAGGDASVSNKELRSSTKDDRQEGATPPSNHLHDVTSAKDDAAKPTMMIPRPTSASLKGPTVHSGAATPPKAQPHATSVSLDQSSSAVDPAAFAAAAIAAAEGAAASGPAATSPRPAPLPPRPSSGSRNGHSSAAATPLKQNTHSLLDESGSSVLDPAAYAAGAIAAAEQTSAAEGTDGAPEHTRPPPLPPRPNSGSRNISNAGAGSTAQTPLLTPYAPEQSSSVIDPAGFAAKAIAAAEDVHASDHRGGAPPRVPSRGSSATRRSPSPRSIPANAETDVREHKITKNNSGSVNSASNSVVDPSDIAATAIAAAHGHGAETSIDHSSSAVDPTAETNNTIAAAEDTTVEHHRSDVDEAPLSTADMSA